MFRRSFVLQRSTIHLQAAASHAGFAAVCSNAPLHQEQQQQQQQQAIATLSISAMALTSVAAFNRVAATATPFSVTPHLFLALRHHSSKSKSRAVLPTAATQKRVPCGFTRPELTSTLISVGGTARYSSFFFKSKNARGDAATLAARHGIPSGDLFDRCVKCGCTVDEHPSAQVQPVGASAKKAVSPATFDAANHNEVPTVATVQVLESLLRHKRLHAKDLQSLPAEHDLMQHIDEMFGRRTPPGVDRGRILPSSTTRDPMQLFLNGVGRLNRLSGQGVDKSRIPLLAVAGAAGTGKTGFLRTIVDRLDTVRDGVKHNAGTDYRAVLDDTLQQSFVAAKKVVSKLRAKHKNAVKRRDGNGGS